MLVVLSSMSIPRNVFLNDLCSVRRRNHARPARLKSHQLFLEIGLDRRKNLSPTYEKALRLYEYIYTYIYICVYCFSGAWGLNC